MIFQYRGLHELNKKVLLIFRYTRKFLPQLSFSVLTVLLVYMMWVSPVTPDNKVEAKPFLTGTIQKARNTVIPAWNRTEKHEKKAIIVQQNTSLADQGVLLPSSQLSFQGKKSHKPEPSRQSRRKPIQSHHTAENKPHTQPSYEPMKPNPKGIEAPVDASIFLEGVPERVSHAQIRLHFSEGMDKKEAIKRIGGIPFSKEVFDNSNYYINMEGFGDRLFGVNVQEGRKVDRYIFPKSFQLRLFKAVAAAAKDGLKGTLVVRTADVYIDRDLNIKHVKVTFI